MQSGHACLSRARSRCGRRLSPGTPSHRAVELILVKTVDTESCYSAPVEGLMSSDSTVFIVDDDAAVRDSLALLLESAGLAAETYASAQTFLDAYTADRPGCLLLDVRMPGMSGLELQSVLKQRHIDVPVIFITAHGDVPLSARAFKAGAVDFLEKPVDERALIERVREALIRDERNRRRRSERAEVAARLERLTPREREVMTLVAQGQSNKEIAKHLNVSYRTVETHRARVMDKMEADSLSALIAMAMTCGLGESS